MARAVNGSWRRRPTSRGTCPRFAPSRRASSRCRRCCSSASARRVRGPCQCNLARGLSAVRVGCVAGPAQVAATGGLITADGQPDCRALPGSDQVETAELGTAERAGGFGAVSPLTRRPRPPVPAWRVSRHRPDNHEYRRIRYSERPTVASTCCSGLRVAPGLPPPDPSQRLLLCGF